MKILVVTLSNLGDIILTLPVIQSLKHQYPEATLDIVGGASGESVFLGDGQLQKYHVLDKKAPWASKVQFLLMIRREKYDLVVDLRYSLIGFLAGAKKHNSYFAFSKPKHRMLRHLSSLKGLVPVWNEKSYLERFKPETPGLPEGRFVAAAVGSKSDVKKWPQKKYAELLDRLAKERGLSVVLIGDNHDRQDSEGVKQAMQASVIDLTGKTDFEVLVSVIRHAAIVVTNDSAPLHIADALCVPTLAIFGPTDPEKYGPRLKNSLAVSKKLFCQPCERAQCRYASECMNNLEPAELFQKATRVLDGPPVRQDKKILVVRLDRLGDVVLSLPAIASLKRRFPDAAISVLTRPTTKTILEGHPMVDEVLVYEYEKGGKHAWGRGYFRFLREIKKRRFDVAVILHPGIRSYLLAFLARIPCRVGYEGDNDFLLTQGVRDLRNRGRKHESQYAVDITAALGASWFETAAVPLFIDSAALDRVLKKLTAHGFTGKRPLVAFHPGASCPSKRWPVERFHALAKMISDTKNAAIVIVGDGGELPAGAVIAEGLENQVANLAGKLDLPELAALLSQCKLLVSNDSGPVHVAAAAGTQVISIFGRNQSGLSPKRWKPLGSGHRVIQKDVGCVVCLAHRCPIEFECLKAISAEDVMHHVSEMLTS